MDQEKIFAAPLARIYFLMYKKISALTLIIFLTQNGDYESLKQFDRDMVLIRDNCFLYNPVGDRIRKDCQHMFDHYVQQYEKLTGKVHKVGENYCFKTVVLPKKCSCHSIHDLGGSQSIDYISYLQSLLLCLQVTCHRLLVQVTALP